MKIIKTAICLILTILIFISPLSAKGAHAQPQSYAYANLGSTVYFCSEKDESSALFAIPQTYCVQILGEEDGWYRVKYAEDNGAYRAVYGYCLKNDVIKINEPLENTYLDYTLQIKFKTDKISEFLPSIEIELTAAYYGEYTLGKTNLSYVYCGDKFGYVSERITDYPLNDLPQNTSGEITEKKDGDGAMLVTALVITLAAAAVIAVLFFSGRKKPT